MEKISAPSYGQSRRQTIRSLAFERLDPRLPCAVNVTHNPSTGHTVVQGDDARNVVLVEPFSRDGAAMHRFTVNGRVVATHPRGATMRIDLMGGNDSFDAFGVSVPMGVYGGVGADAIRTGTANDKVFGGEGNDVIRGNAGNDVLHGGNGNDHLVGGTGNDWLYGEAGADVLDARDGNAAIGGDRIVNPQIGTDAILRDARQNVAPSARIMDDRANHVRFAATSVTLSAREQDGIYDAFLNGRGFGPWRDDVGPTDVHAYDLVVDAVVSDGDFDWMMLG